MNSIQTDVKDFMAAAGQFIAERPTVPPVEVRRLHAALILEEAMETIYGMGFSLEWVITPEEKLGRFEFTEHPDGPSLKLAYDGLADLSYVTNGASNAWGLDLQAGHDEAHDSNMSKFIDGHRREDGKWIKGPSYRPADFERLIYEQLR